MSPAQEQSTAHSMSSRGKIALVIASVIILLPGLVGIVLYSHHRHAERSTANPNSPERDKLAVAADQRLAMSGDLNRAADDYEQIVASYPQDYRAYDNLGTVYARLGEYNKAIEVGRQALKLAPQEIASYEHLAYYYVATQHPEDGHQVIRDAQSKQLDSPAFHKVLYAVAFLTSTGPDKAAMAEQGRWFSQHPEFESFGFALASNTASYGGAAARSAGITQRAVDSAIRAGNKDAAAVWQENAALRDAAFGNIADTRKQAEAGLRLAPKNLNAVSEAALAFAMIGDTVRAGKLADDVNKQRPQDTQIQSVWLPSIRAQIALQKNDARGAVDNLASAVPLELGETGFGPNPTCMYSTYLRGQAYLAQQKGTAAATEFQKIVDHNGVVWNCWTGALAHLGLARAYELEAQEFEGQDVDEARLNAIMAYKDFLKLWKDADPDIAIIKQAQDELGKLPQ
jgi:tetratricopeptide (TPR) repeat protein